MVSQLANFAVANSTAFGADVVGCRSLHSLCSGHCSLQVLPDSLEHRQLTAANCTPTTNTQLLSTTTFGFQATRRPEINSISL